MSTPLAAMFFPKEAERVNSRQAKKAKFRFIFLSRTMVRFEFVIFYRLFFKQINYTANSGKVSKKCCLIFWGIKIIWP
jgi:hypothetical protein